MLRYRPRGVESRECIPGCSPVMSRLLRNRGVDTEEKAEKFLHPSLQDLYDPFLMQDMDKAVNLIRQAVADGVRVQIYGDYDTDGVTATSIMMTLFEKLGAQADYRIPSRHSEGYGLNVSAVKEIAAEHGLLITVDCGINSFEEVRLAREMGMKVIVSDHHEVPETRVPADAVLNPLYGDYPFRRLCGAGVALKIGQAILGDAFVREVIDLAALATVADVVPLIDENRVIVKYGLMQMDTLKRPGLAAMIRLAGCNPPLTSEDLAFRIGPRINAGGRLEDAGQCVELLTGKDPETVEKIAQHLEENNRHRQSRQNQITELAEVQLKETLDLYDDRAIVVMGKDWNTGVVGLAAGRLCEKYNMPAVVLTERDGIATGSCRSIPGVNIHAMLCRCADLFMRFGGHEQAAGLTMDPALVPELRRRLNLYIREACDDDCFVPAADYDMPLHLREVSLNFIDELRGLEPTGFANPPAGFYCPDVTVQEARTVGKDGAHLKLTLLEEGAMMDGIAFHMGSMWEGQLSRVDVLYTPERNEYMGRVKPQAHVEALRRAEGTGAIPPDGRIFPHLLQEICDLSSKDTCILGEGVQTCTRTQALAESRGTLLVGHHAATAKDMAARGEMDVCIRAADDIRPFRTLLICPDFRKLKDVWKRIILLDGDVLPGEVQALREACPRAEILALNGGEFREEMKRLQLDTGKIREVYVRLREADRARRRPDAARLMQELGLTVGQFLTALESLSEVDLIRYTIKPFTVRMLPVKKASPDDSRIMRYIRSIQ